MLSQNFLNNLLSNSTKHILSWYWLPSCTKWPHGKFFLSQKIYMTIIGVFERELNFTIFSYIPHASFNLRVSNFYLCMQQLLYFGIKDSVPSSTCRWDFFAFLRVLPYSIFILQYFYNCVLLRVTRSSPTYRLYFCLFLSNDLANLNASFLFYLIGSMGCNLIFSANTSASRNFYFLSSFYYLRIILLPLSGFTKQTLQLSFIHLGFDMSTE